MTPTSSPVLPRSVVPDARLAEVTSQLLPQENVTAWLEVDLNGGLHFVKSAIILTDQRVLSSDGPEKSWRSWPLADALSLKLGDHAGVGTLELSRPGARLAVWRFTLGLQAAASRWVAQFEAQQAQRMQADEGAPLQTRLAGGVCPVCQTVMGQDDEDCPSCSREDLTPPSTWTLFKLWRFARPYQGSLLAGFWLEF